MLAANPTARAWRSCDVHWDVDDADLQAWLQKREFDVRARSTITDTVSLADWRKERLDRRLQIPPPPR
jgi:hypothetical protein